MPQLITFFSSFRFCCLFLFLLSCSSPQRPPPKTKVSIPKRVLPLSLEIEKNVSKFLIQEPDQELSIELYKIHKGKDDLISKQKIKGVKIPSVIRLKIQESKEEAKQGPVYTVVIHLYVNQKNRFKGLLIIPHWRSTDKPLKVPLRKY